MRGMNRSGAGMAEADALPWSAALGRRAEAVVATLTVRVFITIKT
jgi:hypothetical protein